MCEHLQSMVATERTPELKFGALKTSFFHSPVVRIRGAITPDIYS